MDLTEGNQLRGGLNKDGVSPQCHQGEIMLPFGESNLPEENEDDIDVFAELEVDSTPLAKRDSAHLDALVEDDDPLSAFLEDEEDSPPEVSLFGGEDLIVGFEEETAPTPEIETLKPDNSAESTYRLLLETVWVDDILDPSEVELLARKRSELGVSFERHLELVRTIIGG
tara:strand:+ start:360 stop:869 length:510 start_codon:yes stop_codon:yes gene_type:complete